MSICGLCSGPPTSHCEHISERRVGSHTDLEHGMQGDVMTLQRAYPPHHRAFGTAQQVHADRGEHACRGISSARTPEQASPTHAAAAASRSVHA